MYVTSFKFCSLKHEGHIYMQTKPSGGFVVTGDGTGSFQTVNFDLFKPEKEKLSVLISISLN